jgi:hypothetical protein
MYLRLRATMCPTGQRRRMHPLTGRKGPTVQPTTQAGRGRCDVVSCVQQGTQNMAMCARQDRHLLTTVFFGLWCCLV